MNTPIKANWDLVKRKACLYTNRFNKRGGRRMEFNAFVSPNINQGRFATEDEIVSRFQKINYQDATASVGGLNIISDGKNAVVDGYDNSTMIVGATGSKKTRTVVMPYILSAALAGHSLVIHDCKGDINKNTYRVLKNLGYKIIVLDYRNPDRGERYNPLEYAAKLYQSGNKKRANEMFKHFADTIFSVYKSDKDPFWHLTSAQYFAGLAALACETISAERVTIDNIYNIHLQGDGKIGYSTYIKSYFEDQEDLSCWKRIYPVVTAPNETRSSLNSVFSSCLDVFVQNESIIDQTSHSTFQVKELVEEKTALFIISRDEGSVYNALITAILDQIYEILTNIADENGGTLKRRVQFVLDEFGNLCKLNDIEKKISLSRARNILWVLVCQSLEQLSLVYGKETAPIIIGNCNNLVYLYSPDLELLKRISALCGNTIDEMTGVKRELLSVEQLRHFNKEEGECLMLLDRMHPFITYLPDISQYYGVVPTRIVNVKERQKQKLVAVDFRKIVEEKQRKKTERYITQSERVHQKKMQEKQDKENEIRKTDPSNALNIINEVISKMGEDSYE